MLVKIALLLILALPWLAAQRPGWGFRVSGPTGPVFRSDVGLPPIGPIPRLMPEAGPVTGPPSRFGLGWQPGFRRPLGFYSSGFPFYSSSFVLSGPPATSNVIVIQTGASAPSPPVPAAREISAAIRTYQWGVTEAKPEEPEPSLFSVALTDGSVHLAKAVSHQGDDLYLIGADDAHRRIPLRLVDRGRTALLNREKGLRLSLPAPPS